VTRKGDKLVIRAEAEPAADSAGTDAAGALHAEETVTIERGENAGKTITYHNIVTSWEGLGDWSGQEPLEITVPFSGSQPGAVIVQSEGPSAILAAARVD
jgi:hypothetical protein